MVDWKKDIKLSTLLARGGNDTEPATADEPTPVESDSPSAEEPLHDEPVGAVQETDAEVEKETVPFWKRDLSFRRSSGEVEEDDAEAFEETGEEKKSFFKRELRFGRRREQSADEPFPADDGEDDPVATSVEHDEVEKKSFFSFGRRRGESVVEEPSESDYSEDSPQWVGADTETEETETPQRTPFFKRELSFRRRRGEPSDETASEDVPAAEAADASFDEPTDKKPFFKRELSFRRSKGPVEEQFATEPPQEPEHAETESVETTPFWKRDLSLRRSKDEVDETEATEPGPTEEKTSFFKRELTFGRRAKDKPADEPVAAHEPTPELESVEATPSWEQEPEPASAPIPAEASFAPEDENQEWTVGPEQPELQVSAEPQHEAPEPHVAEDAPLAVPELTFDSSSDFPAPEPAPSEIRAAQQLEPAESLDMSHDDSPGPDLHEPFEAGGDEAKPFWKREFEFGRAKATTGPDLDTPGEAKKPFFKRELGFGRKAKDVDAPKTGKKPFFKRDLRLPFVNRGSRQPQVASVVTKEARAGRKKDLVGLKVGASQIAAARVVNNGSPELVQVARQPIEPGIVVGGELRDPEALADALREFFARHKLPGRNVRLGIGNNRIGVRSLDISGIHDPKQLENAIRYRAQEALPIPLDEAVLDYHVVDESTSQTGIRTYRVLLVVAYRELVDRYSAACRSAGLRLVGIDLEAFALLRSLSPPPAEGFPQDTALVAVSIGHDRSTFAVSNGTVCEFTRVLDWGGSSLNTAIARALDVTPSQAEPVKRTLTLNPEDHDSAVPLEQHTAMAEEAVRLELQSFARELVSSLHFYQNQPGSLAIGSIVLTGGTAHMPGLAAELQRLVGVKVRVGDPLRRVKTGKRVDSPDQLGSLAIAIGLGIED